MNRPLPTGNWRLSVKTDAWPGFCLALALALVLAGALLPARAAEAAAPPLALRRVAFLNFAPAEDSFAATRAAADFTALVQARLTAVPDLEWVERQEHERVRREMELLGAGATRADLLASHRVNLPAAGLADHALGAVEAVLAGVRAALTTARA